MMRVTFLSVGRQDAVLIAVDRQFVFMDGGVRNADVLDRIGEETTELQAYIVSHRHRNHCGIGPAVINRFHPCCVYSAHPDIRKRLIALGRKEEEPELQTVDCRILRPTDTFEVGEACFTCLGPAEIRDVSAGAMAENRNSLILKVEYHDTKLLFTGDCKPSQLPEITGEYRILKAPHHNQRLPENCFPVQVVHCVGKPLSQERQKKYARNDIQYFDTAYPRNGGMGEVTLTID